MCLIIEQPAGNSLTRAEVDDIYSRNRDGFGVVWIEGSTVKTWKAVPRDAADAWRMYQPVAGLHCVLHWRMATHGPIVDEMAHPFDVVDGQLAIVHNGVLSQFGSATESDTAEFVRTRLVPAAAVGLDAVDAAIREVVAGSVIVVATPAGFTRYGRAGLEHAGRWYSNTYAWSAPSQYRYSVRPTAAWYVDDDTAWDRYWADRFPSSSTLVELWDAPAVLFDGAELCDVAAYLDDVLDTVDGDEEIRSGLANYASDPNWAEYCCEMAIDDLQRYVAPGLELVLRHRRGAWTLRVVDVAGRSVGARQ